MKQSTPPIPQGRYIPAVRHGDCIYTSGMTPRIAGKLQYAGKVGAKDSLDTHQAAVALAANNALDAIDSLLLDGERVGMILQMSVFINADQNFTEHSALAYFASDAIANRLGESCLGSRQSIGVASLPGDAVVEIMMVAVVHR